MLFVFCLNVSVVVVVSCVFVSVLLSVCCCCVLLVLRVGCLSCETPTASGAPGLLTTT